MSVSTTNDRRHERELTIRPNDLITAKDCRRLVEDNWRALAPVIQRAIDDAITAERERAWWRRLLRVLRVRR